jgi:hypothetical protein
MSAKLDLERRIADYYASEAPSRAPDRVLADALATIDDTQQRRVVFHVPWRFQKMNSVARLGLAAVAVVALVAFGLAVMGPGRGVGGRPSPSPIPSSSPSSSTSASPAALTQTFTSNVHGISIKYPAGWGTRAATEPWTSGVPMQDSPFGDLIDGGSNGFLGLASQALDGRTADAWIGQISGDPGWGDTCPVQSEPVTVDGASGVLIVHCPDDGVFTTLVTVAGRGYLVVLYNAGDKTRVNEILATVQLDPASAEDASPSPS